MSQETLDLLLRRRSSKAAMLAEPGPSPAQLETILTAASRVPDHKKLEPWRFILFEGDSRALFGRVLSRPAWPRRRRRRRPRGSRPSARACCVPRPWWP